VQPLLREVRAVAAVTALRLLPRPRAAVTVRHRHRHLQGARRLEVLHREVAAAVVAAAAEAEDKKRSQISFAI